MTRDWKVAIESIGCGVMNTDAGSHFYLSRKYYKCAQITNPGDFDANKSPTSPTRYQPDLFKELDHT